ncbi:putative sigma-54 modulation protein [Panacagrimonas perspica]|jgi:putative sigma-54 modulation protein|uniref:Ribosome hibernation promoting factor n=1 Tax=Panacagrimonas perspica TaxID=381431 RepID=A0A4V3F5Z7_9GAMM|nr:ribosome-associated translation inhibitor RaiA [Panacagrimonas perspica]TDU30836.1 putative sigma-54 modulation protein [Panacagrimonas perspica]THD01646.1 ribosomal subunit interface protein [Panacagrimonas perspica]
MNLNISGHHLDLTPPLREYVTSKLKRIERHFDHLINADVILSVEKLRHKAEATVHASGADLHAEAVVEADMYAAIDSLIDKLDQQTRKHKEKLRHHHVKTAVKRTLQ